MTRNSLARVGLVAVLALSLIMAGCTYSQIDAVVVAAEAAVPVVLSSVCGASGGSACLTPAQEQILQTYLRLAIAGMDQTTAILKTGGTTAAMALEITAVLAPIIAQAPNLQGMPSSIATLVGAVAVAVEVVLAAYGAPKGLTASATASPTLSVSRPVFPSNRDRARLAKLHQRCVVLQGQMR